MTTPAPNLHTDFASPERTSSEELERQARYFENKSLLTEFLDAVPNVFVVLNQNRQIVFANRTLCGILGLTNDQPLRGKRPGEALGCIHAHENEAGCGTSKFCATCGAVHTILSSLRGNHETAECRITQTDGSSLDLRVSGSPFEWEGQPFSLFAAEDISHEKRRRVLERLFFHDIMNLAGVLMGYSQLLQDESPADLPTNDIKQILYQATLRLVDEIKSQRELSSAESGELVVHPAAVRALELLKRVRDFYQEHEAGQDHPIVIDPAAEPVMFYTDIILIERVIANLVKNALEACQPGQTVTLRCRSEADQVIFEVHNPAHMPREVELQIFQRSFSTKGRGRGLGTYSVKLFTERYLGGTASFSTSAQTGTVFRVSYPLRLEPAPAG